MENIFGLDRSEFPLYLAEMGILMKMLPIIIHKKYNNPIDKQLKLFVTEDSVSEFIDDFRAPADSDVGLNRSQLRLNFDYKGFMRDTDNLEEMKESMTVTKNGVPRKRFDYVIGKSSVYFL